MFSSDFSLLCIYNLSLTNFTFITHPSIKTINKLKESNAQTHRLNMKDKIIEAIMSETKISNV